MYSFKDYVEWDGMQVQPSTDMTSPTVFNKLGGDYLERLPRL